MSEVKVIRVLSCIQTMRPDKRGLKSKIRELPYYVMFNFGRKYVALQYSHKVWVHLTLTNQVLYSCLVCDPVNSKLFFNFALRYYK